MRGPLAASAILISLVGLMAIATVARQTEWPPFAIALAGWVIGSIMAVVILGVLSRRQWFARQLAAKLAGSTWHFGPPWDEQNEQMRESTTEQVAGLIDMLDDV